MAKRCQKGKCRDGREDVRSVLLMFVRIEIRCRVGLAIGLAHNFRVHAGEFHCTTRDARCLASTNQPLATMKFVVLDVTPTHDAWYRELDHCTMECAVIALGRRPRETDGRGDRPRKCESEHEGFSPFSPSTETTSPSTATTLHDFSYSTYGKRQTTLIGGSTTLLFVLS